jgi:4-methylaminobutanoate oxidase (formaldehyde-forming)
MQERASVVVIGGGVGGCSILYWLARLGVEDALLVERADLTSGSTFHSAGLVGQLRSSLSLTRMMMESVDLYRALDAEVGLETGWKEVGSLRLASTPERLEEITRQAGWAKTFGLPLELISTAEAQKLFPPMSVEGVLAAAYLPTDGYIDPSQLTFALAEGARRRGAEIATQTRVTGIDLRNGRVAAVETDRGTIETETVINAGGMFAGELGALAGVTVPVIPMAHEYLVLEPSGLPTDMPTMRDPSLLVYFRPESGGLIMGGYERTCEPWGLDGIPTDFNGKLLEEDWPRFEELLANAITRVPSLEAMGVVKLINGPEAFTPDGEFILGPSEVEGFWVAAGFCAHGLAGAGGMGKLVAEWVVEGTPSLDVWHMDSRRFGAAYRSQTYTLTRTKEVYETYYDVKYPGHERSAGRPLRVSPTYPRVVELGAVLGEKSGWERVNWFEPNAADGDPSLRPKGWAGMHWSPAIGAEHRACRERVALFDESSFAKIDVVGRGAAEFLEGLAANRVARDVGRITYTQLLNERGGIECDLTVTRLGDDRFRLVTGTAFARHDLSWIREHAPRDGTVHVADVTSQYVCFGLWGPRARDVLQPLTRTSLASSAFRYMTAQELAVGSVPCLAARVTYVGELGWELYAPVDFGAGLWDTLWEAGREHGLVAAGYKAIDSLRLEKGYRVWGADISPTETPFEVGLGFAVDLGKPAFVGRDALVAVTEPARTLCCVVLEDPRAVALGSEPVRADGEVVGRVTSGGYGYTVGHSIAYAIVPTAVSEVGREVAIEIFGEWVKGSVVAEPLYDPRGERIRA